MKHFNDAAIDCAPASSEARIELPSIKDQFHYFRYELFPSATADDRLHFKGYRNLIAQLASRDGGMFTEKIMDNNDLNLLSEDDLENRYRINRVIMIAGARFMMESLHAETPVEFHFGRTIYEQFLENMEKVGLSKIESRKLIPEQTLYEAWNELAEEYDIDPVSFPNAELAENDVEEVLDVDASGDASECTNSEACVLGG